MWFIFWTMSLALLFLIQEKAITFFFVYASRNSFRGTGSNSVPMLFLSKWSWLRSAFYSLHITWGWFPLSFLVYNKERFLRPRVRWEIREIKQPSEQDWAAAPLQLCPCALSRTQYLHVVQGAERVTHTNWWLVSGSEAKISTSGVSVRWIWWPEMTLPTVRGLCMLHDQALC